MVSGLRVTEGVLLFGKESLLLCEGFTLSPSGDVCCRKHHPSRYTCVCVQVPHSCVCGYRKIIATDLGHFIISMSLSSSASVRDSFISTMLSKDLPPASCRRWLYEEIKEARFMRFLLEVGHP